MFRRHGPWKNLIKQLHESGLPVTVTLQINSQIQIIVRVVNDPIPGIEYYAESIELPTYPKIWRGCAPYFEGFHHFQPIKHVKY